VTASDPRTLAADVLLQVEGGKWADETLSMALDRSRLGGADRALATRLVYGVLAWQRRLDHTIAAYASRPLARLDPVVRIALRLGVFQLLLLDRVPDHAAISTSVDLVARQVRSAKGFVNALLRRVQREGAAPLSAEQEASPATHLGTVHSHPDWLAALWIRELGQDDADALMAANNEVAPTCYRALGDRSAVLRLLAATGVEAEAGAYATTSILIDGPLPDTEGLAVAQGEASQLVVELLDPVPGEAVLDACAAPGGKTAAIAARVRGGGLAAVLSDAATGSVVACDPSPRAASRIEATLARAGIGDGVLVLPVAIDDLDAAPESFDAVLVDAPCSGLGTLRQHPEIRWRRAPADLDNLARRQRSILASAARFVRPGGRLVYSTCTIARVENDDVVAAFLASHPEFEAEARENLPPAVAALCDERGVLRTFPHRHGLDGFFAVRLKRRGRE